MTLRIYTKVFLFLVPIAFGSHFVYNFFTKKKKKKEIHEVIMFSYGNNDLKRSKLSRCMITPSLEKLLYYLNSTQKTLDICMYCFTNMDLTSAVMKLHYRGVKIRLIIDADMAFSSGVNVRRFEKQGIPMRWMKSTNIMHHKFCIVDGSVGKNTRKLNITPFVITGSANWTNQALSGNWENIMVTSQEVIVRQFQEEFEKLWITFTPIVDLI